MSKTSSLKSNTGADQALAKQYPMPFVRVELVVLCVMENRLHVLLSHRQGAPYKGKWGLPGGVLRIDLDGSLEAAAQRVALERLNMNLPNLSQVAAVGGADRDPRAPWAMSVVYRSLVQTDLEATPGKRVQALTWRPVDEVSSASPLAFDHAGLIQRAVQRVRQEVRDMRFSKGSVPDQFTLPELQARSEAILGAPLDKVTFRRRVETAQMVELLPGVMRGGSHRPAQVYRLLES